MENIIDIEVGKFSLMKILNQHYKKDALLTLFFDYEEMYHYLYG